MILEGLVTTLGPDARVNVAPMGPQIEPDMTRFLLRPFRTSTTYRNLKALGEGVFHVTDDVLLLARAAVGTVEDALSTPAECVQGAILTEACRAYEFRVARVDESGERAGFEAATLRVHRQRDFLGFNRARHAVLEAAILATRADFWDLDALASDFARLGEVIRKTGGEREFEAFKLLRTHTSRQARARGWEGEIGRE